MKRIILVTLMLVCFATLSLADEPQDLTPQAAAHIAQQTREMAALGIPEVPAREMLTRMAQNRFQQRNQVRAQQMVMEAAKAGLPTEPVMSKAMEGMAKQVGEARVLQAMEMVRTRYAAAHRMAAALPVDRARLKSVTQEVADSLAAGMQTADMNAVMAQLREHTRQQTRNQSTDMALQTMQTVRTMAQLGIPSAEVAETVETALRNRYTYREMMQLRIQMAKQIRFASPRQIAGQHASRIGKGTGSGHTGAGSGGANGGSGGGGGAG
ncbi:hypothetical protein, partial [Desulfosarcina cetonica]|uniref:hypothetical protein n=1 Tax=Desulfosarcina cetonica TaxID=90730 RepID=UPI0006D17468